MNRTHCTEKRTLLHVKGGLCVIREGGLTHATLCTFSMPSQVTECYGSFASDGLLTLLTLWKEPFYTCYTNHLASLNHPLFVLRYLLQTLTTETTFQTRPMNDFRWRQLQMLNVRKEKIIVIDYDSDYYYYY
jgi:hypothetical protein